MNGRRTKRCEVIDRFAVAPCLIVLAIDLAACEPPRAPTREECIRDWNDVRLERWRDAVRLDRDSKTFTSSITGVTQTADQDDRDAAEVCAVLDEEDGLNPTVLKARLTGDNKTRDRKDPSRYPVEVDPR
jgi:hypothetical protein